MHFMSTLASVNVRASSALTALSELALQLSDCKNEECPLGRKQGEESLFIYSREELRFISAHFTEAATSSDPKAQRIMGIGERTH